MSHFELYILNFEHDSHLSFLLSPIVTMLILKNRYLDIISRILKDFKDSLPDAL